MASITVDDVRLFIKDYPIDNQLTDKAEFTPQQIERAVDFIIDDFNTTPPLIISFSKQNFPFRYLLLLGVVAHLYRGAALHQERNHLPVSSGGISVDDKAHASPYTQIAVSLKNEYEADKMNKKIAINMSQGWGGIGSQYYARY